MQGKQVDEMTSIRAGVALARKQHWLWLLPIAISLAGLLLSMLSLGEWPLPEPGLHLRATIPSSIPEISEIIAIPKLGLLSDSFGIFVILLAVLLFRLFLNAGYLAGGMRALRGESVDLPTFWADCKYFFKRLLLIGLLILLVVPISLVALALIHPIIALVAAVVAIMYLFFWEVAVVYEDLDLLAGFKRGHTIMRTYLGEIILLMLTVILISGAISLLLNWLAQTYWGYLLAILIWSIIGATLFIAVIHFYSELVQRDALQKLPETQN